MENNVHTQEFVVEAEQAGERLDRYLTLIYANQSRSFFQKLIKGGNVNVNGKAVTKAGYVLDILLPFRKRSLLQSKRKISR